MSFTSQSLPPEPDITELPETPQTPEPAAPAAPAAAVAVAKPEPTHTYYTIPMVEQAYAGQLAAGKVTQEQVSMLTWFLSIGKSEHLNLTKLAKKIGYTSASTLNRVFRGVYEADLTNVLGRIREFRALWEARLGITKTTFVETSLAQQIFEVCDLARAYQTIVPIYGDSHTGKTTALQEYTRTHNHGSTIYVRMPARGSLGKFLNEVLKSMNLQSNGNSVLLGNRVIGGFNDQKLLIVDEIHQVCLSHSYTIQLGTVEFIRELYDRVNCGVVLCGTNVFRDEVDKGKHQAILEQLRRRSMTVLQLPPLLPRHDMDAIAAAYGLPPATDEIHRMRMEIVKEHGLRTYTNSLRAGAKLAFNQGTDFGWNWFISAHDALAKCSTPEAR